MTDTADIEGRLAPGATGGAERRVGRFDVVSDISETALGALSLARVALGDEQGRAVLLRRIEKQAPLDDAALRLVRDACQAVQKIRHANVVGMLEVRLGTSLLIADEYVEGEPLRSLMRQAFEQKRPFAPRVALRIALDTLLSVLAAKRALVENSMVRPLSGLTPDSLLVASFGEVMIADLGLATLEQPPRIPELIAYRCPVQLGSGTPGDARTEVYSVGVILWELLANRPLFGGGSEAEVRQRLLTGAPEPPSELSPGIRALLSRAVHRSPMQRFENAEALARAIRELGPGMLASNEELAKALDERCHDRLESRRLLIAVASGEEEGEDEPVSWRPTFKPVSPGQAGGLLPVIELPRGSSSPPPNPDLEAIDFDFDGGMPTLPMTPAALASHAALARSKPGAPVGSVAPPPAATRAATPGRASTRPAAAAEKAGPSVAPNRVEPLRPGKSPLPPAAKGAESPRGVKGAVSPVTAAPQAARGGKGSMPPASKAAETVRVGKTPLPPAGNAPEPRGASSAAATPAMKPMEASQGKPSVPPASKAAETVRVGMAAAAAPPGAAAGVKAAEPPRPGKSPAPAAPAPRSVRQEALVSTPPSSRSMLADPDSPRVSQVDLPKARGAMASSDGLEKYAVALDRPTNPVERARVEELDETVIVNEASPGEVVAPAAPAPGTPTEGLEWEPADTKSPTMPPSRVSRNAPSPAAPEGVQGLLAAAAAEDAALDERARPPGRGRFWLSLGAGIVLLVAALALALARSGSPEVEPKGDGSRASVEAPPAAFDIAPRTPERVEPPKPAPVSQSAAPEVPPVPSVEESRPAKRKRAPLKPALPTAPAAGETSPAADTPPPPPPPPAPPANAADNPY